MGLLLRALVERLWSSAAHATPFAVTLRSRPAPSTRVYMRFLVTGATGAVQEDFLETSLVCLRSPPGRCSEAQSPSHSQSSTGVYDCNCQHFPLSLDKWPTDHRIALVIEEVTPGGLEEPNNGTGAKKETIELALHRH